MTQPSTQTRPANVDEVVRTIQREFPAAAVRITGRGRTLRRQAELMADRIRVNRQEFLGTYVRRPHIIEMDTWFAAHPQSTREEAVQAFERIIRTAVAGGATVSNHLSDTARDISWPRGTPQDLDRIEQRFRALGASVIREPNAAGGRHWHVDR